MPPRLFVVHKDEHPTDVTYQDQVTDQDITRAANAWRRWAEKNAPELALLLKAKVEEAKHE